MEKQTRTTKTGTVIKASVKSYFVTTKIDITTGTLDQRGDETSKMFANVVPKKTLKAGEKVCLRMAYKKFNGNLLLYLHRSGWMEIAPEKLPEVFAANKTIVVDDLTSMKYEELSNIEKVKMLNKFFPGKYTEFTKTEQMLMAYLEDKDLNEVEKEIKVDKSLKYKIKKHADDFAETFAKKLEGAVLA
jgi:hypothetical protein